MGSLGSVGADEITGLRRRRARPQQQGAEPGNECLRSRKLVFHGRVFLSNRRAAGPILPRIQLVESIADQSRVALWRANTCPDSSSRGRARRQRHDFWLPINTTNSSWFLIANGSQFLYVFDDAKALPGKLKSGQVINGIGAFWRAGYAPPATNTITADGSVGLFAHGFMLSRPYDSVGVGYYHNAISSYTKSEVRCSPRGPRRLRTRTGWKCSMIMP